MHELRLFVPVSLSTRHLKSSAAEKGNAWTGCSRKVADAD